MNAAPPSEGDGLVPRTLSPLLHKRLELKAYLGNLPAWDPRRDIYKARASAHKWLLVTCFGYLGYRNARFGRIEAHEAVTAYGREALTTRQGSVRGPGVYRAAHVRRRAVGAACQGHQGPGVLTRLPAFAGPPSPSAPTCRFRWMGFSAGWLSCPRARMGACRYPTAISACFKTAR